MNTNAEQMFESKFNFGGLILAIIGGILAAAAMGYAYFLVANKVGIDYIIALAVIVGIVVGAVVGALAKIGRLRVTLIVFMIAFVFGLAGYAARYFFEYNDAIEQIMQENGLTRQQVLDRVSFNDYLQFVADSGFSIGSRDSSSSSDAPIQGGAAYGLLGVELLAAGLAAGFTARSTITNNKKNTTGTIIPGPPMQTS